MQNGKMISARYTAKATFEKGGATVTLGLIRHGDQWQILRFDARPHQLIQHNQNLEVERDAQPSETHPYGGFWKIRPQDEFGFAIGSAAADSYYVSFCGPRGCSPRRASIGRLQSWWAIRDIESWTATLLK
jgi:hypothetical protein